MLIKLTTKGVISQGLFKNNRFYFDLCVNVSIWELNKSFFLFIMTISDYY